MPRYATKEEIFGHPEDPTPEQLSRIAEIAAKLGPKAATLTEIPPVTKNEAQAIIELYGRFV